MDNTAAIESISKFQKEIEERVHSSYSMFIKVSSIPFLS